MTPTSSADGPILPRAITADRYSDGTAFGSPHARPVVPPAATPRAIYPEYRPPGMRGRSYLIDVASAALATPEPGCPPALQQLLDGPELVADVCRDYTSAVLDLERMRAQLADANRLLLGLTTALDCEHDTLDALIIDDPETP